MEIKMKYIYVPFSEKDEAKSLGAKWNSVSKLWYIPDGLSVDKFDKWMDPKKIMKEKDLRSIQEDEYDRQEQKIIDDRELFFYELEEREEQEEEDRYNHQEYMENVIVDDDTYEYFHGDDENSEEDHF